MVYCMRCRTQQQTSAPEAVLEMANGREVFVGICDVCGSVGYRFGHTRPAPSLQAAREEIPELVARELNEAKAARQYGLLRACVLMTRVTLETACRDQGAARGTLEQRIQELGQLGTFGRLHLRWASFIRQLGNRAAHADGWTVEEAEVDSLLSACEQLLHFVYVRPVIEARWEARRALPKPADPDPGARI